MQEEIDLLKLEQCLFKLKYMTDLDFLNNILENNYLEIGKSGCLINKNDVIEELSSLKEDRNIVIYNFTCCKIDTSTYLVHYITKNKDTKYFRTSIWKKINDSYKIIFHQASEYKEEVD